MGEDAVQPPNEEKKSAEEAGYAQSNLQAAPADERKEDPPDHTRTPHREEKKRRRKPLTRFQLWSLILAGIGILVAGGTGVAIFWQDKIASSTLSELQKQYPKLRESANAAKSAANTARTTLENGEATFRLDERAWVEIDPARPILAAPNTPSLGPIYKYELYLRNTGKTSARQVKAEVETFGSSLVLASKAQWMNAIQNRELLGKFGGETRGFKRYRAFLSAVPTAPAPESLSPVPIVMYGGTPQNLPKSKVADVSYLVGRVDYEDQFRARHWMTFCFFVSDAAGDLRACQDGNNEDSSPETPRNKKPTT